MPFRHPDGKLVRMTAHEYDCFKQDPTKVPARLQPDFEQTKLWEARSKTAKLAARRRAKAHA